jgi:ubiquitin-conjugating enzyme E2 A
LYSPVYSDGSLCLDVLAAAWKPIYTVSSILTSIQVCAYQELKSGACIALHFSSKLCVDDFFAEFVDFRTGLQSLLTDPNPASPANPEAAQMYREDIKAYNRCDFRALI